MTNLPDPTLEDLWKKVLDEWDDDRVHGAFLEYCQTTDRLVEAAVRYRGMAGDRERAEAAKKRLQGVAILAMAKLESSRTARVPGRVGRVTGLLVLAFFVAATAALLVHLNTGP